MRARLLLLSIVVLIIGFSACKKNNDAPAVVTLGGLNMINASADTINLYLNGTRLNSTATILPGYSTGYENVPEGQQSYQLKKQFNPTTNTIQTLFSITIPGDSYPYHSLFVTGETASQAFYTVDALQNDTLTNTCLIRFVNASPNSGNLDLAVGDTVQFSSVAFKSATDFKLVSINATTDSLKPFKVYKSGSTIPIISGNVNLGNGYSYTFYTKGTVSGTGNSLFSVGTTINVN